jgi:hypothetical protein
VNEPAPQVRQTDKSVSLIIGGEVTRHLAHQWVDLAPLGCVITVEREPRTPQQADKFYAICTQLAQSDMTWNGKRKTKEGWHDLLIHAWMIATGRHPEMEPGLEGGMVSLLMSTKKMKKPEMSELLDYTIAWATSHGINIGE